MFNKMDEMEKLHSLYAIKMTFAFTIVFEVIYFLIECYQAGAFVAKESTIFFLIICQGIVLTLSNFFWKFKVDDWKGSIGIAIATLFGIGAIVVGFMLV